MLYSVLSFDVFTRRNVGATQGRGREKGTCTVPRANRVGVLLSTFDARIRKLIWENQILPSQVEQSHLNRNIRVLEGWHEALRKMMLLGREILQKHANSSRR